MLEYLDPRSTMILARVNKLFQDTLNDLQKGTDSASFLVNTLVSSGYFDKSIASKNEAERKIFLTKAKEQWRKLFNRTEIVNQGAITFVSTNLSAKMNWSDLQIKKLCRRLNYDAIKTIKDNPHSWTITY